MNNLGVINFCLLNGLKVVIFQRLGKRAGFFQKPSAQIVKVLIGSQFGSLFLGHAIALYVVRNKVFAQLNCIFLARSGIGAQNMVIKFDMPLPVELFQ